VVSDDCLPYDAYEGTAGFCMYRCKSKSESYKKYGCKWDSLKVKTTTEDIQNELMENGPMMVGFMIYEDFFDYATG